VKKWTSWRGVGLGVIAYAGLLHYVIFRNRDYVLLAAAWMVIHVLYVRAEHAEWEKFRQQLKLATSSEEIFINSSNRLWYQGMVAFILLSYFAVFERMYSQAAMLYLLLCAFAFWLGFWITVCIDLIVGFRLHLKGQ
jgi:hypothetical protein